MQTPRGFNRQIQEAGIYQNKNRQLPKTRTSFKKPAKKALLRKQQKKIAGSGLNSYSFFFKTFNRMQEGEGVMLVVWLLV